ncbi:hypothetical protein XI08_07455 [Bradyrhizobium sp. CCBAU 11361]|nr:hypothetical protein [Bradyrhizobium sp. CCBAU 11361]
MARLAEPRRRPDFGLFSGLLEELERQADQRLYRSSSRAIAFGDSVATVADTWLMLRFEARYSALAISELYRVVFGEILSACLGVVLGGAN